MNVFNIFLSRVYHLPLTKELATASLCFPLGCCNALATESQRFCCKLLAYGDKYNPPPRPPNPFPLIGQLLSIGSYRYCCLYTKLTSNNSTLTEMGVAKIVCTARATAYCNLSPQRAGKRREGLSVAMTNVFIFIFICSYVFKSQRERS